MSTRSSYPPGVPCWVAVLGPDVDVLRDFYGAMFGWTYEDIAEPGNPPFYIASLHGDRVGSVAGPEDPGTWIFAVSVRDVDETAHAAVAAGGSAPGEPTDIATLGRFHRLLDPAGTEVHVGQLLDGGGARRVNEPGAWSMSILSSGDPWSVAPFYEALFGWALDDSGPSSLFRLPGYVGGEPGQPMPRDVVAMATRPTEPVDPAWTPDFRVADSVEAAATATAGGGRVVAGPFDAGNGFQTAVLADPGGAVFSVSAQLS